ncbi:MAG: UbiD family decarboxylase [Hyphomicrobiaceae bacterium]
MNASRRQPVPAKPTRDGSNQTPFTTLRDWLAHLASTGRLAVARPNVGLRFELAAIAKRLDGERATLFPSPDGHAIPVVSGIVSDRHWIAEAMGVPHEELLARFEHAANNPLPCVEVADAPVQEVVETDPDLTRDLPIPTHNEHDSGPYIAAGLIISRNPETGRQNVAIVRLQVSGPKRLAGLLLPRHTHHFFDMAEAKGQPLHIAIVIGSDPLTLLSSQAIAPLDQDELEIAGALQGRPLPVVRCKTSDLRVPAEAECVIEGRLLPKVREPEGPFGEFPQYYATRADRHVIEVDALTRRSDALFHTIIGGGREHLMLGGIPREATLLAHLKRSFPNVRDVHLAPGGVCRYHLYVKIAKRSEGEPKNIMMGAFAGHYDVKLVVVVDEDVDIHNPERVEWAIATRFQADRGLLVVTDSQGSKLDPTTRDGVGAKMGIDATKPVAAAEMTFKRIRVPGEESVDLAREIDDAALEDWRARLSR